MKKAQSILIIISLFISGIVNATEIKISSLKALAKYASQNENAITMPPGVYQLTDYLPIDSMIIRHDLKEFTYIVFSGSNNIVTVKIIE